MDKTYLERVKTEFVTDPKLKQPITQRTKTLRETLLATTHNHGRKPKGNRW